MVDNSGPRIVNTDKKSFGCRQKVVLSDSASATISTKAPS